MPRPKGALNKNRRFMTISDLIDEKGINPAEELMKLIESGDPEMRFKAANALMPYRFSKLSSIEVKGEIEVKPFVEIIKKQRKSSKEA